MLGTILTFLGGPLLTNLLGAYKARLENASGQDKMAVELAVKEIESEIEARKQAAAIIIAEQGTWFTRTPRAIVQWAFALFIAKVVIYDNMLGLGSTDPIAGQVGDAFTAVLMMWFGGRTIEKVAQVFGRR